MSGKGKKVVIPTWLIVVILLLVIFTPLGLAIKTGALDILKLFGLKVTEEGVVPGEEYFRGVCTIKVNSVNVVDDAAESLTSSAFAAYHGAKGPGVSGLAISASGTDFAVDPEDEGIMYLKVYAGTAHYTVMSALVSANPRIDSYEWTDLDANGLDDLILTVDLNGIKEQTVGVKPEWTLVLPVIDEDVTGLTDDNPADQSGIGTTEKVVQITWDISGASEKAGFVISRLYFTTNETREGTDIKLEELTISGMNLDVGYTLPVFTQSGPNAGDYEAWYLRNMDYNDYHRGLMAIRWSNKADKLSITLSVRCTFESGDKLKVQLEMEYVQAEGTIATLQDDVVLLA